MICHCFIVLEFTKFKHVYENLLVFFFVISEPLIEKTKPYSMPLLPHKNVFLLKFTNKYMNIRFCYFCSLSTFSCRSWWFAIISSCRSFIYVETYKHDN